MLIDEYAIRPLNRHYEGAYDHSQLEWRRIAANDKVENIQRLLKSRRVATVLEVGCGTGAVLAEMARRGIGATHCGVDLADPREHIHPGAEGFDLRTYDGERLPFGDRSFDLVVATHVVEHVPHPRQFIAELSRVCAGFIYVEVPCEIRIFPNHRKIQLALDTGHINGYTPEYFLILLQTSELQIQEFQLFDHSREVYLFNDPGVLGRLKLGLRRFTMRCSPLVASRLFCYHCGALALPRQGHHTNA